MHPSWLLTFLQIILESLPISSSTHISFFASQFALPFEVALDHAVHGITLIVILLFWQNKIKKILLSGWSIILQYGLFTIIASIPPSLLFFFHFKKLTSSIAPFYGVLITAVLLFVTRYCSTQTKKISYLQAIVFGCAQSLALLPGISRMGITYSVGRFMHHSPHDALWLSCLIVIGLLVSALLSYAALFITYTLCTKNKTWIFSLYLLIVAFLAL